MPDLTGYEKYSKCKLGMLFQFYYNSTVSLYSISLSSGNKERSYTHVHLY